jgi:hypothetical protein
MRKFIIYIIIAITYLNSQVFTDINAGLQGFREIDHTSWIDYDNDGDLDIFINGSNYLGDGVHERFSVIYQNDNLIFNEIRLNIDLFRGASDWGDYDNDGRLDLLISGYDSNGIRRTKIFRNNEDSTFTDINADLAGLVYSSANWGDYDNDGDLDILINGQSNGEFSIWLEHTFIYRNDNGSFARIENNVKGFDDGSTAWGDYDNDGDLDIVITGNYGSNETSKIYRNDNGTYVDINADIPESRDGCVDLGDYDNDGDLDILLTGDSNFSDISCVLNNDNGNFVDINAGMLGVRYSSCQWGDYDNDGDLDILLSGIDNSSYDYVKISKLYSNDAGIFTEINIGLDGYKGNVAWGDYDNDGDLDILFAGYDGTENFTKIYRNNSVTPNTIPNPPSNLEEAESGYSISLSWDKAIDNETPQNGLSYNFYLGNSATTGNACDPMSDIHSGYRKIIASGNAGMLNSKDLNYLPSGTYFWGVQSIDNNYAGSAFSTENTFIYNSPLPQTPTAIDATEVSFYELTANLKDTGDKGYNIELSYNSQFTDLVEGYEDVTVITGSSFRFTGLKHTTTFFYRVRSYNGDGTFSSYSNVIEAKTLFAQFSSTNIELHGVSYTGNAIWGDYDNDGDLDILLNGRAYEPYDYYPVSYIYRNDDSIFVDVEAGIEPLKDGSAEWGDYDNDGDLDFIIFGDTGSENITKIYNNNNGNFVDINAGIIGISNGDVSFGDLDNDGDLDLLLSGYTYIGSSSDEEVAITRIYYNVNGEFNEYTTNILNLRSSSMDLGDYDNDGDLDLVISGSNDNYQKFTKIYINDRGTFDDSNIDLEGVSSSSVFWCDYDNDGDLDLSVAGYSLSKDYVCRIYRNDTGIFNDINAEILGLSSITTMWADYDNDGDLDLFTSGYDFENYTGRHIFCYRNDSGTFLKVDAALPNVGGGSICPGDYDNDGDLDIVLTGYESEAVCCIYINNSLVSNSNPIKPVNLTEDINGYQILFNWDKSNDNETRQDAISYSMYIGNSPFNTDYLDPMSDISSGFRKIPVTGNSGNSNSHYIRNLPSGTYYWAVQAIDNTFSGSLFSEEKTFTYNSPLPVTPTAFDATEISFYEFTANWQNTGDAGYNLELSYDSLFTDIVPGYDSVNVVNRKSYTFVELLPGYKYYYRVRSYNGDGKLSEYSNTIGTESVFTQFTQMESEIIGVGGSTAEWGDYDNDGDLDILLTGVNTNGTYLVQHTKIYRNDNDKFVEININIPNIDYGSTEWGDYDNDGDLDIMLIGFHLNLNKEWIPLSTIYRNDDGVFTDIEAGLQTVDTSSADFGDYDNDGDLDIILTGYVNSTLKISKIYRNDSGTYTDISADLTGISLGSAEWSDFDCDGDLDLLIAGNSGNDEYKPVTKLYKNDNGIFIDSGITLTDVGYSDCSWGDYDNDGDPDILLTGYTGFDVVSKIYRNDLVTFTDIEAGLPGVGYSSVDWGDYDNDGDLDIIMSGLTMDQYVAYIYVNDNGMFNKKIDLTGAAKTTYAFRDYDIKNCMFSKNADLTGVAQGALAWGDYDNDRDLDIIHTGKYYQDDTTYYITELHRNNTMNANIFPKAPGNIYATEVSDGIAFNWDQGTDAETPQDGLSYNLYVGSESGKCDIISPMSKTETGYRKVVETGNASQSHSWNISGLPDGTYYWSVQTIDNCFEGSPFAPEQTFIVTGIEDSYLPYITALYQNYPNPFNPVTVIKYSLANDAQVELKIFDIMGREVSEIINKKTKKGYHQIRFNGNMLTSGMYFYRLKVDGKLIENRKMMMIK